MNRVFPALRGIAILLVVLNHTIHMGTVYPKSLGLAATLAAAPWERWILYSLSGLEARLRCRSFSIFRAAFFLTLPARTI
ncbi:MAG: hypothetical protein M5U05_04810 [Anaerolineales bacterium]|nr:hypothetical protein [Anaerolineales bacterium]